MVMKSKNGDDIYVDCRCGCDSGMRIRIDKDDDSFYCLVSYTNGNFSRDQNDKLRYVIYRKLKKIWCIIKNQDFCYSEICMTKDEFKNFQECIANIE